MIKSVLAIAMLCHAANAAYCASIGDHSQVGWEDAPDWQRQSAINGVEFCLANPEAPASANHESWMAEKVAAGWVYGETKDPEASPPTHPCIVPFDQLPAEQQFKDILFKTIVAACDGSSDDLMLMVAEEVPAMMDKPDVDQLAAARAEFDAARTDADAKLTSVTGERDAALAEIADLKGKLAKSEKAAAKVTKAEAPPKPRKLGPIKEPIEGEALREAIAKAETVEIAFSDGKSEIAGLAPIAVEGDVWKPHAIGTMLREPVTLHGPQRGEAFAPIDGYALILDGKPVAYTKRSEPIKMAPGGTYRLDDDIYFA